MRCQCSKKPEKKRGKCGECVERLVVAEPDPTAPNSCVKSGVASLGAYPTGDNAAAVWKETWSHLQQGGFTGLMLDYMADDATWNIAAGLRLSGGSTPQLIASATQDCDSKMDAARLLDKWNTYGSGSNFSNPWVALAFDTTNALSCTQTGDTEFCTRLDKAIRFPNSTSGDFKDVPIFYNVEVKVNGNNTIPKSCTATFKNLKSDGFNVRSIGDAYSIGNMAALNPCTDVVQSNPCLMHSLDQPNGSQTVWGKCTSAAAFSYFDAFRWKNGQKVGAFPCTPTGAAAGKVICSEECAKYISNKFEPDFPSKPTVCF